MMIMYYFWVASLMQFPYKTPATTDDIGVGLRYQ